MKTRLRGSIVLAFCVWLAGCAAPGTSTINAASVTAGDAKKAVAIGKTTKAELVAALGKTTVVSFDSGFEVWVYRLAGDASIEDTAANRLLRINRPPASTSEFVVLFAPSGVVAKTRIRPAPPPAEAGRK